MVIAADGFSASAPRATSGEYTLSLPGGTMGAGQFVVSAGGSGEVGTFSNSISSPQAIQLTTTFSPGTPISGFVKVDWAGGDPDSIVQLEMHSTTQVGTRLEVVVPATAGTAVLGSSDGGIALPGGNPELVVRQLPTNAATFTAPGLTLGGRHVWSYEFHFPGLKIE